MDNDIINLCEPVARYSKSCKTPSLFSEDNDIICNNSDIRVIELFAGVGGFRVGLERASSRFKTIWNNQWEPSTKRQDASIIYCRQFGLAGHVNEDINLVSTEDIPDGDILVGGFPCQDYSVATTLKNSGGIEGKKGVLWWQIHRILREHKNPPKYLLLENVDRLLSSPASQRGRDFAIILASLSDLGYYVEWRVINAADYGMPQRRKRTYILAFHKETKLAQLVT
ncbi:MAG: DNA (cytosine-5-)-methyltransferase, partial [Muribaculaceae bacterium]|nr:DNA (cytosine-5-)-methyltransferase [Muribaculaceae bacterium]